MITVNPNTRQFNIPGTDLVFGVEDDSGSVIKQFQVPRYVGNDLDLTGCFIRMNYRNANGEIDTYLVQDVAVEGDNIVFGWELSPKVTMYKGNVSFVMCVVGPDTKVKWHTTLGRGQVLEGLEPDSAMIEEGTADVVAALIAMVEAQTEAVADTGAEWVQNVQSEGTDQIIAVQTAGAEAKAAAVAEIEAKGVNVRESIPDDYTALSEAVDTLNRTRGAAIVCEAAGSAITVNDASDNYVQGLRIFGRSTQDGTPTPDAPVEIKSVMAPVVEVCGKNLAYSHVTRETNFSGVGIKVTLDKSEVVVSGTAEKLHSYGIVRTRVLPVGKYTVSVYGLNVTNASTDRVYVMDSETEKVLCNNVQDGKPKTFEMTKADVVRVDVVFGEGSTYENRTIKVQVERGEVATEYESYKVAQTVELTHTLPGIPVTSDGNYTDSDGQQWICDEVDLERGVYVQRIGSLTFTGEESWSKSQYYENTVQKSRSGLASGSAYLCNMYAETTLNVNHGVVIGGAINIRDDAYAVDVETWKTHLGELYSNGTPVVIIGALTDPIETPLSETEIAAYRALHSNYPNTTVLNSAGAHMVVKYVADTKLYIDNKITALVGG